MTAPDRVIKPSKNFLRGRGHPYMAFVLDGARHAPEPGAELVLHPGIDAFGHGAEIEEPVVRVRDADAPHAGDLLGAFGFLFMLRTKIAVDQRRMAERLAVPVDAFGALGCAHRLIEMDDEGAGKGGCVGNLPTPLPSADSAQRLVGLQAFYQGAGGWNAEQSLGDEASGQGAAILGWAARASRRLWNEGLETDHVEDGDEPAELFGHRLDFLAKPREKRGLYVIPARPHGVERIVSHLVRRHGA